MLSKFFYFFSIFDMNGSKRWFQTKFWFWLKHVLLVAFLNSTFFNNKKTYCIIQHKKMLTLSILYFVFWPLHYKKDFNKKKVTVPSLPEVVWPGPLWSASPPVQGTVQVDHAPCVHYQLTLPLGPPGGIGLVSLIPTQAVRQVRTHRIEWQ